MGSKGSKLYPDSGVEISGILAKYYEFFINFASFGTYNGFIERIIKNMNIKPADKILDLGAGNGYNACKMAKYLSSEGELLGLDIGDDMIETFRKKCSGHPNVKVIKRRIDTPFEDEFKEKFDKVFISFVIHGLPHESRLQVLKNAAFALKKRGEFFILDYNEFDPEKLPFYKRAAFQFIECPYAFDYVRRDWKKLLSEAGFGNFEEKIYFLGMVRLLKGVKG